MTYLRQDPSRRLVAFSGRVIRLVNELPSSMAGKKIADQLLRSAMSVGANYEEARGTDSRLDFAHKLQISLKERRETYYWLTLIAEAKLFESAELAALFDEAGQLRAILGKLVATLRARNTPR